MFRIDNSTSVPGPPAPPAASTPGFFTDGNPTAAQGATIVDDWWLNQVQEEILTVITRAGLIPNKVDTTQLYQAILGLLPREKLSAPFTVYVAPAGSDTTGDGSSGNPFATLQRAWNFVTSTFDFAGQSVTIQLADGTYTAGLLASGAAIGAINPTPVTINGSANVTLNVTGNDCVVATSGAGVAVQNLTLRSTANAGGGGYALAAIFGGLLTFGNVTFGPCTNAHAFVTQAGIMQATAAYSITGGAPSHMAAVASGYGQLSGAGGGATAITVTLTGNPNFSTGFVSAATNGLILAPLNTFAGSATGPRFAASTNAVIDTSGKNAAAGGAYFPGSTAGTTATGGLIN